MLEIILGIIIGIIIGFTPGLHPNLIAHLLQGNDEIILISTIFYLFLSYFPLVLFKISSYDKGLLLALNPKKELLKFCVFSSFLSITITLICMPLIETIYKLFYIKEYILYIVIFLSLISILKHKPICSFLIFVLSGCIGYLSISLLKDPLLTIFAGFFSIPLLLEERKIKKINIEEPNYLYILPGIFLGIISNFLPGVSSPGQLIATSSLFLNINYVNYFILTSSILSSQFISSFASLKAFGKARNGVIKYLNPNPNYIEIFLISVIALIFSLFLMKIKKNRYSKTYHFIVFNSNYLYNQWS